MFKRSRSILALDIGSHTIKALEVAQEGDQYVISSYGQMEIPSEETQRDVLREVISAYGIRSKRVVTAVSGRSVIVRYVSMLPMSNEDLQNAIKFEADKYIPFEVDEVVLDCQKIDENQQMTDSGEPEMKVLLVAVKRSLIEDHITLLQQSGLQPTIIDIDAFALGNAFEFRDLLSPRMEEKEKVVALIDIGANKTNINIKKGRVSFFTREIYLAGNDFTDAIAKRLGLETHEAETLKKDPGDRIGELMESVAPTIEDLGNEIHLSFDYYENQFDSEVEEVYLSGGGAKFPHLDETFTRIFDRKTALWNPTENFDVSGKVDVDALRDNSPQLAIAVGLAARLLD